MRPPDYEDYFKEEDDSKRTNAHGRGGSSPTSPLPCSAAGRVFPPAPVQVELFASRSSTRHFLAPSSASARDKILDVGCGVGGLLREIAAFTDASVTGLNNNAFQIKRGEEMNAATGRHDNCDFIKADFMNIPKPDATYDAVYQIGRRAARTRSSAARDFRVLKPGGVFASSVVPHGRTRPEQREAPQDPPGNSHRQRPADGEAHRRVSTL